MNEQELLSLLSKKDATPWRIQLARWIESPLTQKIIIVSTMQELSTLPDLSADHDETVDLLLKIEKDLASLRGNLLNDKNLK